MRKKSQVYKRMSGSYILVVVVFVLIAMIGYLCSYNIIRDEAQFYNERLLETIKSVCDKEVESYYNILNTMKYQEELRNYVSIEDYDTPEARLMTLNIMEKMGEIVDSMGEYSWDSVGTFLFLKEEDRMVSMSSNVTLENYINRNLDADPDEIRRILQEEDKERMVICRYKGDTKYHILLHNYMVDNQLRKGRAVVGMWVKLEALTKKIDSVVWNENVSWSMVDDDGNIIACSPWLELVMPEGTLELYADRITLDNTEYRLNWVKSQDYNWHYVLLTNNKKISSSATKMELIYFACAVVLLLVGYESVRLLMKLHYNPIKQLAMTVAEGEETIQNEYQFLERRMTGLRDMYKDAHKKLLKSDKMVRDYLLEKMLSTAMKAQELTICEEIHDKFCSGENVVVVCRIRNLEREGADGSDEEEEALNRFIVSNVYTEEMSSFFELEALELENAIVFFINLSRNKENYLELLENAHNKLLQFLKQYYSFNVCMYEGDCHSGVEGIHRSYLEACEAEEYLKASDVLHFRYRDIRELPLRSYDYSLRMEERLYNALHTGNAKLACSYVEIILKNNFGTGQELGTDMQICLLYDIYGTLLKVSEELGVKNCETLPIRKIIEKADMDELIHLFNSKIQSICDGLTDKEEEMQWKKLCQNVLEYIHENYTDPDLKLTPGYLASKYRTYTGSNIPNVINEMRIEHSKILLKEDISITEIAERVGFRRSSSFIRVFKQYTGITPGQMREMNEKKSDLMI